jgi:hypothetical protein
LRQHGLELSRRQGRFLVLQKLKVFDCEFLLLP